MKRLVILTGPTASGKSEICRTLSELFGCTVINCDSKQVYTDVPVITDQPIAAKSNSSYKLYGYIPPNINYSVGLWLEDAKREVMSSWEQGVIPIITGGSGLYVSSLASGLSDIPEISYSVREEARKLLQSMGTDKFYELLIEKDSEAAVLDRHNPHRLLRAFEVITETGISIVTWRKRAVKKPIFESCQVCVLLPPKEELYAKIDSRFVKMMESSAISEVEYLMSLGLSEDMPIMKAHGVPEIIKYLLGEINLHDAVETAQKNTRHYAKRQFTWFKRQLPPDTLFFEKKEDAIGCIAEILR